MALADYAVTITKMCNWALTAAGARNRITDIDVTEDTEEWELCDLFFWQAIMEALQDGRWRFATDRAAIVKDATDPAFGTYSSRLAVPTGSLIILYQQAKSDDRTHVDYKREGDWILTNTTDADDTGYIGYIKMIDDVTKYPPLFVRAAYVNLAIKIRASLKGASAEAGEWNLRLQREYDSIIVKALGQNNIENFAIEGNTDVVDADGTGYAGLLCDGGECRPIC